ncbi:MAG TPA: hypothetical protein VFX16_22560 [Pseudonocardiaceae bacterium]|nr:hypothetical protein [Pseudonocardiaceae bacterium]
MNATTPPGSDPQSRRVVVVPSLWAPFHHRPAVAALAGFTTTTQPDGIVFLSAPNGRSSQAHRAFIDVLAQFRTGYQGAIMICGHVHDTDQLASLNVGLNVGLLPESAPIAPGWQAVPVDLDAQPDVVACAATADTNMVCGDTGRLRLTGRAVPAEHGTLQAWLVFECGTLAADPAAGTLGFGILETNATTATGRPVRVGADGSFTYRGTRYQPP